MRIFIVRKDDKVAVSTQEDAAEAFKAERILYVDRQTHDPENPDFRPTDVVGIFRLDLLAAQGKKASKRARQSLLGYMTHIFRNEATLIESSTGRTCGDKAELLEMYEEACSRFLRGYKSGQVSGRPKTRTYSNEQALLIDSTWHDKRYTNNAQRIEAIIDIGKRREMPVLVNFNQAAWYDKDLQNQIKNLKEQSK